MNWTTLLRFRKQVEDLAREEVVLAEWEKSQIVSKRDDLMVEIEVVASELDQRIRGGIDTMIAEQRYQWLDQISTAIEHQSQQIQMAETKLVELRATLKKAHHARRVVELVIAKKEEEVMQKVATQEQQMQEDVTAHAYATSQLEEMIQ
ncbi:flagellar FliJ family protein [Candidatus Nitrospira neomarina]|uniref:Flagellar FliJ protein n=1 Tax=Candidatus Nitrospira neomarina TaxID=3020899 RepID=A0AA96GP33_9BACT|nr:flagellar FliJ family protein [Candidatus Nitrospira neomarina]WNM62763.1 flagellar FliJ family protein [Candidatus Nitrospira neomarina]